MNMTKIAKTLTAAHTLLKQDTGQNEATSLREPVVSKIASQSKVQADLKRVAAYARVSTGKDTMLHSLGAQVSYYSGYIQRRPDWLYAGVYADKAHTGTKEERPEFQRLLADCKAGMIDLIVVKSISRFSRNTLAFLRIIRELRDIGVNVYFEEQNIYSMSGDGEMMLTLLAAFAQAESQSVSENCKWRIRKRFANGEPACLSCMYGYDIRNGSIEINREETEVVRMIFSDYQAGMGVEAITKKLNSMGIPAERKKKWAFTTVWQILKNEKYTGNSLLQKTYVPDFITKRAVRNQHDLPMFYAENTHPAIIDMATFMNVQTIMEQHRIENKAKDNSMLRYPFTGKVKCGNCGRSYIRKLTRGDTMWQCKTYLHYGKAACPAKQVPESVLYECGMTALGTSRFDVDVFRERIKEIQVPAPNTLVFHFYTGKSLRLTWQDRSRRDSWTDEMRERARQHAIKRYAK